MSTLFLAGVVRFVVGPPHLDLRCPRPFFWGGWVRVVRGGGPCLVAILGAGPSPVGVVWVFVLSTGVGPPWHQGTYFVAWFVRPCRPFGVRGPAWRTVRAKDTRLTGQGAVSLVEGAWSGATGQVFRWERAGVCAPVGLHGRGKWLSTSYVPGRSVGPFRGEITGIRPRVLTGRKTKQCAHHLVGDSEPFLGQMVVGGDRWWRAGHGANCVEGGGVSGEL